MQSPSTGLVVAAVGLGMLVLGTPAVALRVRRRPHGFLPVSVIRNATVVRSAVAAAAVPASWFALLIAVPAVLVHAGWEAWQVGLLLVPSALVAVLVPRVAGPLLDRIGAAPSLAVSGVIASVALGLAALGSSVTSPPVLAVAVALVTVAFGLGQPALSASVGDAVHVDVRGVALGIATLLFLVGGSIGSAVVGGLGDVLGIAASLALLAVLPLLGLGVLVPELRRGAARRPSPRGASRRPDRFRPGRHRSGQFRRLAGESRHLSGGRPPDKYHFPRPAGESAPPTQRSKRATAVQRRCVPPRSGSRISRVPSYSLARRSRLARPLDRVGVPMPRPSSMASTVSSSWARVTRSRTAPGRGVPGGVGERLAGDRDHVVGQLVGHRPGRAGRRTPRGR